MRIHIIALLAALLIASCGPLEETSVRPSPDALSETSPAWTLVVLSMDEGEHEVIRGVELPAVVTLDLPGGDYSVHLIHHCGRVGFEDELLDHPGGPAIVDLWGLHVDCWPPKPKPGPS